MASQAEDFVIFDSGAYTRFKQLFLSFSELCEEFQILSHLTEEALARFERSAADEWDEHRELEDYFRKLQVPMLHAVIRTNLRLLNVWQDRMKRGEGLPYGSRELFIETVRIIHNARSELLRPRYAALLEEAALDDADQADHLLRGLMAEAPQLLDFAPRKGRAESSRATTDDLAASLFAPPSPTSLLSTFN